MKGILAFAAIAGASMLFAAPAAAQGTSPAEAVFSAARCVAASDPRASRKFLHALPGSVAERRASADLAPLFRGCADGRLPGGHDLRATLALAMVRDRLATRAPNLTALSSATPWYASAIAGRGAGEYSVVELGVHEFGTCVIKAAPQASADLLAAASGSAAERQAVAGLRSALPGCVSQGAPLKLNAANLRLMLAEPFYHAVVK